MRSLHQHYYHRSAREDIRELETALDAESDRKKGLRIPKNARFPQHLFYSEVPKFTSQLERYVEVFGWQQIHVVVFDDLVEKTESVSREVLRFLGVDQCFLPEFKVFNYAKKRKSVKLERVLRNELVRRISKMVVPRQISSLFVRGIRHLNTIKSKNNLVPRVRKRLEVEFTSEIRRLSHMLGRDLTHWTRMTNGRIG